MDLRIFVLLGASGLLVWLAVAHPTVAAAVGLGLTTLYGLHRMIGH